MAEYTMTLEDALKFSGGYHKVVDGYTKLYGGDIGLNFYPIFDENYREHLNGLIYDHYREQEIGTETLSMFQLFMRRRMNEIMPYFNKLYELEKLDIDPLSTVNIETTSEASGIQTASTETSNESVSSRETNVSADSETGSGTRNVQSTTPQMMLAGSGDYASSAADATGKTTVQTETSEDGETSETSTMLGSNEGETESSSLSKTSGYQGHTAELLNRYRDSIVNVDALVIGSLTDLFMLTWGTNISYS